MSEKVYNFTKVRKQILPPQRITLSKTQLHITQEVYEIMGKPETLGILYDKDAKAIKLVPNDKDAWTRKVKISRGRYYSISITLAKFMPLGMYSLEDKDRFIFVLATQSRKVNND